MCVWCVVWGWGGGQKAQATGRRDGLEARHEAGRGGGRWRHGRGLRIQVLPCLDCLSTLPHPQAQLRALLPVWGGGILWC